MHNQSKLEESVLQFWRKEGIYRKVKEANSKGKEWYFCDGPPYATGEIHPGTAWNKCLKDAVCRYRRARGYSVRAQPGYDTHGLPIEVKVEQEMGLGGKKEIEEKVGIEKFVHRCREFATKYIGVMGSQFERAGAWMDWQAPYVTYKDEYIDASWSTIARASEQGLLSRGVYVLPYCSRCQTTIANYELEYDEQDDPSIYVKFKVAGAEDEYLVIWTTTPWTLVSNIAVMVHPTYTYVKVQVDGEKLIVAKDRLEVLMAFMPLKSATVLGEFSGKKLDGAEYELPLQKKIRKKAKRKVVMSDEYVTLEDGSGLVHCAPGHGPEDFVIGRRYGLDIFSPLDSAGKFTHEAGEYEGMLARESNKRIIEDLDSNGALIHAGKIRHRYPHCWRCKTPLVFMTTDQWFIGISQVRGRMLEEIEKVGWTPDFAKTRFRDFVAGAPDWCISRQRYWGIPLPIWECACGERKVVGSKSELPEVTELHRPYIDRVVLPCPKCKKKMERVPDVLDVWFDSGNAIWASLAPQERLKLRKADFIIEGKDQTRGWFYSLLGSGVVQNGEAPYAAVGMHGFFVDEKGEKMSKSVGNFVPFNEMIGKFGADSFRLWSLSNTYWDDLKFNWEELKEAHRKLGILYNMGVFLERFCLQKPPVPKSLETEDRWMLSRLAAVTKVSTEAFEGHKPHEASRAIISFLVEDVSRFYIKLVKERLDCGRNADAALHVTYRCMLESLALATPIVPFICEDIYQRVFRKWEGAESISLLPWPATEERAVEPALEKQVAIAQSIAASSLRARQQANVKLRWPLAEAVIVSDSTEVKNAVERLANLIELLSNVKKLKVASSMKSAYSAKVNFAKVGAKFKEKAGEARKLLEGMDAGEIVRELAAGNGKFMLGGKYEIERDMVELTESAHGYAIAEFDSGKVFLKTEMSEALLEEAMVREAARRIQLARKEEKLLEGDSIAVRVAGSKELVAMLKRNEKGLAKEVNAESIEFQQTVKDGKKWEIAEYELIVGIRKVEK
jgi:isoleucyl-tRNA synthetase